MKITLQLLGSYLEEQGYSVEYHMNSDRNVSGVRMLLPETRLRESMVYILRAEKWKDFLDISSMNSFILVNGDDPRFSNCNRLVVADASSSFLYQLLLDMFDFYEEWQDQLDHAVMARAGVQTLLELSSSVFFDNPLSVVNSSMLVLGYLQNKGLGLSQSLQMEFMNHRYLAYDVFNPGSAEEFVKRMEMHKMDPPSIQRSDEVVSGMETLTAWLTTAGGNCLGKLTIAQYVGHFGPCQLAAAGQLAQTLCQVLEQDAMTLSRGGALGAELLLEIIEGNTTQKELILQLLRSSQWDINDCYQVMLLRLRDGSGLNQDMFHYFSSVFRQLIPDSRQVAMNGDVVILCRSKSNAPIREELLPELKDFAKARNAIIAFSLPYRDFFAGHDAYLQADAAVEHTEGYLRFYEDCFCEEIISSFTGRYASVPCIPELTDLLEYDQCHRSELIRTLYTYLLCERSYQDCSNELNIHRSTLRYRLQTIERYVPLAELSGEKRLTLMLNCRMLLKGSAD